MQVFNTLFPVFVIVLTGWLLRRFRFADLTLFRHLNQLVYWVGLPCLLFLKTAQATIQFEQAGRIFLVLLAGMLGCFVAGYMVARLLSITACNRGVFLQGAYRGNLAYVGLPLILFALAEGDPSATSHFEALAVIAIAPLVPVYNVLAVVCLLHDRHCASGGDDGVSWGKIAFGVVTNPLILACVAGIGWALLDTRLPVAIERVLGTVGGMALPLALMGLGASLSFQGVRDRIAPALGASAIKLVIGPVLGIVAGKMLGLTASELKIAVIYLACPTAVASYVMAHQMRADHELAASIVVLSTVLAFPVLAVLLWWL